MQGDAAGHRFTEKCLIDGFGIVEEEGQRQVHVEPRLIGVLCGSEQIDSVIGVGALDEHAVDGHVAKHGIR